LNTHHLDEGTEQFATDEAYNEKGGKSMEAKAEADYPVDVLDCTPTVDIDHPPKLKDLDWKQDGVIDAEEAHDWGHKACVPDEMTDQIFSEADSNQDQKITPEEYENSGEGTSHEEAIDKALEAHSEGDDEYNRVHAPPLEEFDENNDGGLDDDEYKKAVKFEMERRNEGRWDDKIPEGAAEEAMEKVDTDNDGKVEGDEYVKPAADDGSDLGEEISEAAKADEDANDPDDLARADGKDQWKEAPPAASMLSTRFQVAHGDEATTRFQVAQRDEAAFLRRFNLPENDLASHQRSHRSFGHAFVELARKHQARRHQQHRRTALRRHRVL